MDGQIPANSDIVHMPSGPLCIACGLQKVMVSPGNAVEHPPTCSRRCAMAAIIVFREFRKLLSNWRVPEARLTIARTGTSLEVLWPDYSCRCSRVDENRIGISGRSPLIPLESHVTGRLSNLFEQHFKLSRRYSGNDANWTDIEAGPLAPLLFLVNDAETMGNAYTWLSTKGVFIEQSASMPSQVTVMRPPDELYDDLSLFGESRDVLRLPFDQLERRLKKYRATRRARLERRDRDASSQQDDMHLLKSAQTRILNFHISPDKGRSESVTGISGQFLYQPSDQNQLGFLWNPL